MANLSSVVNTSAAPQIVSTGTLAAGQTDIGLSTAFPVNRYSDQQVGAVMVYVGGQLLMRNAGNAVASQTADGNYQEVDAGAGYSSLIRLNVADPNNSRPYVILSNGFNVAFNETSVQSQIQTLQTQQDNMATTLAEVAGIAVSSLYTPLNDATRATFASQFSTLQADAALKNVSNTWTQPQLMLGQTNGAAIPTGYVGQVLRETRDRSSSVALTSGVNANVTANTITLTPGVWLVSGSVSLIGSATAARLDFGLSSTSATLPTASDIPSLRNYNATTVNLTLSDLPLYTSPWYVNISSPSTLYLVANSVFTGGTCNAYGYIQAIRIA